jgi:hypothetical protein
MTTTTMMMMNSICNSVFCNCHCKIACSSQCNYSETTLDVPQSIIDALCSLHETMFALHENNINNNNNNDDDEAQQLDSSAFALLSSLSRQTARSSSTLLPLTLDIDARLSLIGAAMRHAELLRAKPTLEVRFTLLL